MRTRTSGRIVAALLIVLVFGAIALHQYGAYRGEMGSVAKHLDHARLRETQARAAERRLSQLDEELTRQAADLEKLALILPSVFDSGAMTRRLQEVAGRYGVEVEENGLREKPGEPPLLVEVSYTVFGTPEAVETFTSRIHTLARLQAWTAGYRFPGGVVGTIQTWYWPPPLPASLLPCRVPPRRKVWLPPLGPKLAEARAELDALCDRLDAKKEIIERIERFEDQKLRIRELVDTINELKTQVEAGAAPTATEGKKPG